jgi:Cu(I)/Ag(I) efflux system membrane fusion protein
MKKRTRAALLVAGVAVTFAAGAWYGQQRAIHGINAPEASERLNLAHAGQVSDAAGTATDAGGQDHSHHSHVAQSATDAAASHDHSHHAHGASSGTPSANAGSINVAVEQQALLGVRVDTVDRAPATHRLRLFGRVAADEARVYKMIAGVEGSFREVSPVTTGSQVKKDQVLATFTAPSSATVIQLYMTAATASHRAKQPSGETSIGSNASALAASNLRQRTDQLYAMGMSTLQMEEMARTGEYPQSIKLLAPASGFIMARNASVGQTFEKGTEYFRIADLSRVWIVADVFERDAQHLRPGTRVEVSLPNQDKTISAKVSQVLPQFDPASRTLKVRFEADNPGFRLRPEMLVDVGLQVNIPASLAVPIDAVVDSGLKKTVFVERAPGQFEPREVQTGRRLGERVEIVQGLAHGERIVTSGTFFLDSESRMKLAVERMQANAGSNGAAAGGHAGHSHHAH